MATRYRAEHVGSLLRPPELLEARAARAAGRLEPDALRAAEDQAIRGALALQREVGLDVYSDGEFRRDAWMSDLAEAVEGFVPERVPMQWRGPGGGVEGSRALVAGARLRQTRRLTAHESSFLLAHSQGPFKVTMPSPSVFILSSYRAGITDRHYATRADLLADLVPIVRAEIRALIAEGVPYIQLDAPQYTYYLDPAMREGMRREGIDPERSVDEAVAGDVACLAGLAQEAIATQSPTAAQPGPTTQSPTAAQPGPTTPSPAAAQRGPTTPSPTAAQRGPTTPSPTAAQRGPTTESPTAAQRGPTTESPTAAQRGPTTESPTAAQRGPTTESPTAAQRGPTTESPTAAQRGPTTESPTAAQRGPTTESPTAAQRGPTTESPTAAQRGPTTESPTAAQRGPTLAFHLCRGNNRSRWIAEGGYDAIAERLFGSLPVDTFLLEYDSERAGDFAPLRFVPRDKTVALGLITTKSPELEAQDDLRRRIDAAARYLPLENLALSPQCGFASVAAGNLLSADDQRRKLELLVDTARKVWG